MNDKMFAGFFAGIIALYFLWIGFIVFVVVALLLHFGII